MLPNTIENLEDVDPKYQAFYTTAGDGGVYTIDSNLTVDTTGLKNTNQALKDEKTTALTELAEVKATLDQIQADKIEETLLAKEEYTELLTEKEKTFATKLETSEIELASVKSSLISNELAAIAQELAGENAALLAPHLLGVEYQDGLQYPDGLTRDEFIQKFKEDTKFLPLTQSQKASGSGATSTPGGSTHVDSGQYDAYFDPNSPSYSPTKQYELQQENPELYKSLESKYGLNDPYNTIKHIKQ